MNGFCGCITQSLAVGMILEQCRINWYTMYNVMWFPLLMHALSVIINASRICKEWHVNCCPVHSCVYSHYMFITVALWILGKMTAMWLIKLLCCQTLLSSRIIIVSSSVIKITHIYGVLGLMRNTCTCWNNSYIANMYGRKVSFKLL